MINRRLLDYLERVSDFALVQTEGLKGRSNLDRLIRLETHVRRAFAKDQQVVSVFFDIEKPYDQVWRYGILSDLHRLWLRGVLPMYIAEFMASRLIRIRSGNILSKTEALENGIPQGSVLSVTLFLVKIDAIVKEIP